ncbi:hypothetical protein [Paenibacillus sp. NPDC058071]|uniref:hypothetical protein n=1 Tax=Paenibacillus sp. NPDC058071 TaxID=3346326 RepID=UPI0036DE14D7
MKVKGFVAALAAAVWLMALPVYAQTPEQLSPEENDGSAHSHAEEGWQHGHDHHKGQPPSASQIEEHRLAKLRYMAKYFGISTEGKTAEQLKTELQAAKAKDAAKWEAFKKEHQAKRLEHLRRVAKEHGIQTEGKSADQLLDELRKLRKEKESREGAPENPQQQQKQPTEPQQQQAPKQKGSKA